MRIFRKADCTAKKRGKSVPRHSRKPLSFGAKIRRCILIVGIVIFLYFAITTFFDMRDFFQGSWTGKTTAATTRTSLHLLVEATPWTIQAVIVGCGLYLWAKYTWIMSAVLGVLTGIWLAL